jgi:hypothetical protein
MLWKIYPGIITLYFGTTGSSKGLFPVTNGIKKRSNTMLVHLTSVATVFQLRFSSA